jgi:predicted MFS family arabinose efflux permease
LVLRRQRVALSAIFAVHGFLYASWAVRVPAIKQQTGASAAALGLALLGLSAGAVATMLIAGALCRRFGSRRVTVPSCGVLALALLLPPLAHSAIVLGLALVVFGAAPGPGSTGRRASQRDRRPRSADERTSGRGVTWTEE